MFPILPIWMAKNARNKVGAIINNFRNFYSWVTLPVNFIALIKLNNE